MDLFLVKHKVLIPIFLCGYDLSISDFALSVVLLPMLVLGITFLGMRNAQYYPRGLQNAVEFIYEKFHDIFFSYLGKKGEKYIPFLFSLMSFIFILNIGNLVPGVFASTSQLALTLTLALIVFCLIVIIGFYEHGLKFWGLFVPHGVPLALKPFLFVVEFLSFLIRPVSLALRLATNMVAGHAMLHVVGMFGKGMGGVKIMTIAISVIFSIFEVGVAALQAYVFAILSCLYIADILQGHA